MRWIAGLLLVSAAILKAVGLVVEPAVTLTSPVGRWFLPVEVGAELGVGLWVLSGLYWQRLRWIVLAIFAAFAAYSLHLAVGGAASCGCFGPIKIHPWWTFLLDMAVLVGLLFSMLLSRHAFCPGVGSRAPYWLANRPTVAAVIVSLSVLSTAVLVRYANTRTASADDLLAMGGDLVILEPDRWIGHKLPIADAIDLDLSRGNWIVLLHRHDCPDCQEAVPGYEQLANQQQVALVEVPLFGEYHSSGNHAARYARLSDDREWFVQTPVEIQLTDGVVTSVSTELPALLSSTGY